MIRTSVLFYWRVCVQVSLKPCPYRLVDNDGCILCNQIKAGNRQVSADTCQACPIAEINCTHLRATLHSQSLAPLTVRWGNGKTQVWADPAPPLVLERAACAVKTIPISSPRDCAGCDLRRPFVATDVVTIMPKPARMPPKAEIERNTPARTNVVAQKILRLQEWLAQKKASRAQEEEPSMLPLAFGVKSVKSVEEERRVGWTD